MAQTLHPFMNDFSFPTYRAIDDYQAQRFQLLIWMFEHLRNDPLSHTMIETFGEEGYYDQIGFHQKLILAVCECNSNILLYDYLRWRYTVCLSRGIPPNYFIHEHTWWIQAIQTHLFEGYALEFVALYQSILKVHDEIVSGYHPNPPIEGNANLITQRLIEAILKADEAEATSVFAENLYVFGSPSHFFDRIVKPTMIAIGRLWENNVISVVKEHLATAMVEYLWNKFSDVSLSERDKNTFHTAFVITPDEQLHKLGSKMVAKVLSDKGWRVAHFGLQEKSKEIYDAIIEFNPQMILLSASMAIYIPLLQHLINALRSDECLYEGKIVVGGQAFYRTDPPILLQNVDFQGETLHALEEYLDQL